MSWIMCQIELYSMIDDILNKLHIWLWNVTLKVFFM